MKVIINSSPRDILQNTLSFNLRRLSIFSKVFHVLNKLVHLFAFQNCACFYESDTVQTKDKNGV